MSNFVKLFSRLSEISWEIQGKLPLGFQATAVLNGGGKILIYMPTAFGKHMFAELVPDESKKHLKVVMVDSIEMALKTIVARIEL